MHCNRKYHKLRRTLDNINKIFHSPKASTDTSLNMQDNTLSLHDDAYFSTPQKSAGYQEQ